MRIEVVPKQLHFKFAARTSRGVYLTKQLYYILLHGEQGRVGVGEAAPLPDLSADYGPAYYSHLCHLCKRVEQQEIALTDPLFRQYPSILFALETAYASLASPKGYTLFPSPFTQGAMKMRINGLIWMGEQQEMLNAIAKKLDAGFSCLKLKVGNLRHDAELSILQQIRKAFSAQQLEIRLDANGAFAPSEVMHILHQYARYHIHSIEQPIAKGNWELMRNIVEHSPIPIALDEELIGVYQKQRKQELLQTIRPHYIVLKPTLHGGLCGADEWIALCEQQQVGWWATSALESNVGLQAIAQWVARYRPTNVQGLGTGLLYTLNVATPLTLQGEQLSFDVDKLKHLPPVHEALNIL